VPAQNSGEFTRVGGADNHQLDRFVVLADEVCDVPVEGDGIDVDVVEAFPPERDGPVEFIASGTMPGLPGEQKHR
jgi:hypothetical protein